MRALALMVIAGALGCDPGPHRAQQAPVERPATQPPSAEQPSAERASAEHGETVRPLPDPPSREARPLFRAYPKLAQTVPYAAIGTFPTPVEHAIELGRAIGVERLYLKRDDRSAEPYGGGKVRKLELFLGAAERAGASRVVTIGGVGSNHAVATAVYAHARGMGSVLLLLPQPPAEHVRQNLEAALSYGAEIRLAGTLGRARAAMRQLADAGAYAIPAGGSSPLGDLGFVNAGFELSEQIRAGALPKPDRIYLAMGTMGSAIGLAIGLASAGVDTQIVAVRASNVPTSSQDELEQAFARTASFLRERDPSFPVVTYDPDRLRIEAGFLGKGYARPTVAGARAGAIGAEHGLVLESTYTEKTMAALIGDAGELRDRIVLFWVSHHIGPLPLGADDRDPPPGLAPYLGRPQAGFLF